MENIIIILIVLVIVLLTGLYIFKSKKKGKKCIGCPYTEDCPSKNSTNSSCCTGKDQLK